MPDTKILDTKILANDIHDKWSKLNVADLTHVRSREALSALVMKAYRLDKEWADAEVTVWMVDRSF